MPLWKIVRGVMTKGGYAWGGCQIANCYMKKEKLQKMRFLAAQNWMDEEDQDYFLLVDDALTE